MFNEDLNLKTKIKISGLEHDLELFSIERGVFTQIRLDDDVFDLHKKDGQDMGVLVVKPGVSKEIEQTNVKPEQIIKIYKSWTPAEDKIIVDKYQDYNLDEIILKNFLPGRTKSSIANRIHRIQFHKYGNYKKTSINFDKKILAKLDIKVFEQCFNRLVFKLGDQEFFDNKFVFKILRFWYKAVLDVDLSKKTKCAKKHYIESYIKYGVSNGFFERIGYDRFRFKKAEKVAEKVDETTVEKVKVVSDSKPIITIVDVDDKTPVKGFTEHAQNRIKEIRERRRLFEKEIGDEK